MWHMIENAKPSYFAQKYFFVVLVCFYFPENLQICKDTEHHNMAGISAQHKIFVSENCKKKQALFNFGCLCRRQLGNKGGTMTNIASFLSTCKPF